MSSENVEPGAWPLRRRWTWIGVVFAAQIGLIFWLSDKQPIHSRPAAPEPTLRILGDKTAPWLELANPALFALPNPRGFSGLAWRMRSRPAAPLTDWTEPPRWLELPLGFQPVEMELDAQTNRLEPLSSAVRPMPWLALPELPPQGPARRRSTLRIGGPIAGRTLLVPLQLESQTHQDLLTNSVVQVLLNADGLPVSTLLLSSSGSPEADQRALDLARQARFARVGVEGPDRAASSVQGLAWGRMIFEWKTELMPATNSPLPGP